MNESINDLFSKLRKDVKVHFYTNNLAPQSISEDEMLLLSERHRLNLYHSHKNALSRFCGWDAPNKLYDQDMFDLSLDYLSRSLLIGVEAK